MNLPTMAQVVAQRRGKSFQKPLPRVLVKAEQQKTKAQQEKEFRTAVWARDCGRSRASGKPLARSGTSYERVGEIHHVLKRSTHPEQKYDPANGILLSKAEHCMAETACPGDPRHALLDIVGPADLSQPQTFIWFDVRGEEIRRRVG